MTTIDELKAAAANYREQHPGPKPAPPSRQVAIVTCMDARIDVYRLFGLGEGEAHVIRNAGGVVTPDVLRSLAISQRVLGTREVVLMHHTGCGLIGFDPDAFRSTIRTETGVEPTWASATLHDDLADDLRQAVAALKADPVLPVSDEVRGFVYDVKTGELLEVDAA